MKPGMGQKLINMTKKLPIPKFPKNVTLPIGQEPIFEEIPEEPIEFPDYEEEPEIVDPIEVPVVETPEIETPEVEVPEVEVGGDESQDTEEVTPEGEEVEVDDDSEEEFEEEETEEAIEPIIQPNHYHKKHGKFIRHSKKIPSLIRRRFLIKQLKPRF